VQFPDARILIFAKAPQAGQVKTRLIPAVGAQAAAALYAELLHGAVARLAPSRLAPLQCCCAPDIQHHYFLRLADEFDLLLEPQQGADLGQRMLWAARQALQSCAAVVLIGGDCPPLMPHHLQQALQWLTEGADAVLGPAEDGGYVLFGLRRVDDALFSDIAWGGPGVLASTRQRLQQLGWQWRELEALWDLDRPEDLQRYQRLNCH